MKNYWVVVHMYNILLNTFTKKSSFKCLHFLISMETVLGFSYVGFLLHWYQSTSSFLWMLRFVANFFFWILNCSEWFLRNTVWLNSHGLSLMSVSSSVVRSLLSMATCYTFILVVVIPRRVSTLHLEWLFELIVYASV
jgi:hypothetical protein